MNRTKPHNVEANIRHEPTAKVHGTRAIFPFRGMQRFWNLRVVARLMKVNSDSDIQHEPLSVPKTGGRWPGLICRLPKAVLVAPMIVQWLWLSLRYRSVSLMSAANPAIAIGGLVGESKIAYFAQVQSAQSHRLAHTRRVVGGLDAHTCALKVLRDANLSFPIIAKPDIGWCGFGVRRIDDAQALRDYVSSYPHGETLLLQEYLGVPGEAGLFYVRWPGEEKGRLLSLTVREPPGVTGDGYSTVGELLSLDPFLRDRTHLYENLDRRPRLNEFVALSAVWSHRMGGRYRDMSHAITAALETEVDSIARGMTELHIARFDVRFSSLQQLRQGEFKIMEINGAGSEAINFFDRDVPFFDAYRGVLTKTAMVFAVADRNRKRGFRPCGWKALLIAYVRQHKLLSRYPSSN